ncbi:heavy metal translocating P-type ATPase [Virgibacillus oceani]|uniref:P-type Cu(+) transporter n=1 Tax=Virgibacillus oceani TaxID=1479511 RepID=A0A917M0B4_9BACI|nr:heavy metal translocating P-type ATPase [Virgibacillus oceani]GGG70796.1 copper-translocating P-type ATPase [Virgibacillus oceani]
MPETNYIDVKGMHCAACAVRIEKAVSKIDGVNEINVNLTTEKGRVSYNKDRTSISVIINKINKIGFEAKLIMQDHTQSGLDKHKAIRILYWKFIFSSLLTFPLAWAMFAHFQVASFIKVPALFTSPLFQLALTIPIQFIIGFQFYERACKSLKSGSGNMDVLVVLSTSAAFFYSHYLTIVSFKMVNHPQSIVLYYETSAFIITFILLGKLLEAKTKMRTTDAIKNLYQLQLKTATLYVEGREFKSSVENLIPGDTIILKPGEKIPIDGQILQGTSMIDESLLTGESLPVNKIAGDIVYAGTINQNGLLKIQVTKKDSETVLSQIIRIVEEAQSSKAPIQQIADKITSVFVPVIIIIAMVTFIAWYTIFQPGNFNEALEKVIAVLIIACPCALGLATPTSVMVGSGQAAQKGILFKEGKFLELLGRCNTVILDKTGTLTKGTPQVTDIYVDHFSENAFLEIIGAVETGSEHPIAKAILSEVHRRIRILPEALHVTALPGLGIKGYVNSKKVVLASRKYIIKENIAIPFPAKQIAIDLENEGKTVMIALVDSRFAGIIAVADEVKTSSFSTVSRLKQIGLDVVMLTGDNRNSGVAVARKVGIEQLEAEVTPQEKAAIVRNYQQNGNQVVMVGDGINDAPALAVSDIGVAIGSGSDIAIESGDVTIIKGDLNRLVDAITISKKTMTNIKQNFLWAFLYNIVIIPFAMLGFMAPWLAGAAMAFSSVSVVLNSLRLKKLKFRI